MSTPAWGKQESCDDGQLKFRDPFTRTYTAALEYFFPSLRTSPVLAVWYAVINSTAWRLWCSFAAAFAPSLSKLHTRAQGYINKIIHRASSFAHIHTHKRRVKGEARREGWRRLHHHIKGRYEQANLIVLKSILQPESGVSGFYSVFH